MFIVVHGPKTDLFFIAEGIKQGNHGGVIALSIILALVLMGNILCVCWKKEWCHIREIWSCIKK